MRKAANRFCFGLIYNFLLYIFPFCVSCALRTSEGSVFGNSSSSAFTTLKCFDDVYHNNITFWGADCVRNNLHSSLSRFTVAEREFG